MARDYQRKRKTKAKKRGAASGSSPWTFLASGFGLGLVAALVLYLQLRPQEAVEPDRPIPNASVAPQSSTEREPVAVPVVEKEPVVVEAPKTTPAVIDSEYDFYEVLPDFEVVIADEDNQPTVAKPAPRRPSRPAETPGKPATYILQAGSFRKFIDADRRKAELAFKGIESNIQQVVLKKEETWFRVYVGPDTDFASFENMRSELRRANIDVLILKVSP